MASFARIWARLSRITWVFRLLVYFSLTRPSQDFPNIRFFRFHLPFVLKISNRTFSTESDALRILWGTGHKLPIPRLIDSIIYREQTYTVMTKLPGTLLVNSIVGMSETDQARIFQDIKAFLVELWSISQPTDLRGQVMLSASGDGITDPVCFHENLDGPYPSTLRWYARVAGYVELDEFRANTDQGILEALSNDPVAWMHPDLRTYNILVHNGRLSGIIDCEESGWYPRHWHLFVMRFLCKGCRGPWNRRWKDQKFDDVSEAAYSAAMKIVICAP